MNEEIIRFRDVTVRYGRVTALEGITADVHCGGITAIVGPNGAGKSTLLRSALGWHRLASGTISLGDDHISHHHPRLAYVPQRVSVDWDFPLTVRDVVEQGRFPAIGRWRAFGAEDHRLVDAALHEMEMAPLQDRQIGELSGGEQQRMVLARALAQGGDIFLLDEPFKGLDAAATRQLMEALRRWHEAHRTIVAVVHDLDIVRELFEHLIVLKTRIVASGPTSATLTAENIERAYGERARGMRLPAEVLHG